MLAVTPTVVKLSDAQQVVIADDSVEFQDARGYSPRLISVMSLEDAIAVAKAVLALQQQAEDAALERQADEWEERLDAERFNWDCAVEDDFDWIRTGC